MAADATLPAAPGATGGTESAEPPGEPTAAELDQLIRDLQDPEARAALIRELEALRQAQREAAQPLPDLSVSDWLTGVWQRLLTVDAGWLLEQLLWSALVVAAAVALDWLTRRALARLHAGMTRRAEGRSRPEGLELGGLIVRLALVVLAAAVLMHLWGFELRYWLDQTNGLGWIRTAVAVLLVAVAALVLWSLSDSLIAGALARQGRRLRTARQRARLKTVTPLIQGTARIVIGTLAVLLILSEVGVEIGPLLAGAGIIGLAVGFGAQSLIKDMLVGVTLLIEDAASVGDVVEVGGAVGQVEDMSIRMMRLRDLEGTVHLVPYSEVTVVKNLTKDFAYALLDVSVAYRESVDEVIDELTRAARELRQDPELGPFVLGDLDVMGVERFADSAVVIRIRLMTTPMERWRVARAFRRRIKTRFDAVGIEIPFPHQTLYFGRNKDGTAPPLKLEGAPRHDTRDGAA